MGAPVDVQDVQRWGQCGNASFGFQDTTYGDISWMNWTDQAMQSQMGVVPAMPGTCGWQDSSCVIAPMPSCVNSEITNWTEAPAPTPASKLNANAPLFVMPQKEMPPDLMAIAMPSAMGGMSKEQIACLLKEAAANECYED